MSKYLFLFVVNLFFILNQHKISHTSHHQGSLKSSNLPTRLGGTNQVWEAKIGQPIYNKRKKRQKEEERRQKKKREEEEEEEEEEKEGEEKLEEETKT